MPAKKKPAKKAAVKKAVARPQKPSKARSPKKRPVVPVAADRAPQATSALSTGAVSFWWGRLRWEEEAPGKVVFKPYASGEFLHRVSLVVDFGVPVAFAVARLGDADYGPKVEDSRVIFRFQPPNGQLQSSLRIEAELDKEPSGPPVIYAGE